MQVKPVGEERSLETLLRGSGQRLGPQRRDARCCGGAWVELETRTLWQVELAEFCDFSWFSPSFWGTGVEKANEAAEVRFTGYQRREE